MVRKVIGVIVGYIAMSITLFVLFSGLYVLLGTSGSFQDGNFNITMTWILSGLVVFFVGGSIAGFVYGQISKAEGPVIMAGVILLLGLLIAVSQTVQDPGVTVRDAGDVSLIDAMNKARQPIWALIANPIAGFLGAMIGGRSKG
jgi:hypothetical protein